MNILFSVLQILLALHTFIGAVWKFFNPEQGMSTLDAIPHGVWLAMAVVEILCSVGLILGTFSKSKGNLAGFAAIFIAAEMLLFCGLQLKSGDPHFSHIVYWLVVAAVCTIIAYGRLVRKSF